MFRKSAIKKKLKFLTENDYKLNTNSWNSEFSFTFMKGNKIIVFDCDSFHESLDVTITIDGYGYNILNCPLFCQSELAKLKQKVQDVEHLLSLEATISVYCDFLEKHLDVLI